MKRLSFVVGLFLVFWFTPPARTQEARTGPTVAEANPPTRTEARVLYQAWRALQRQNGRDVRRVRLRERIDTRFDGPTGSWNTTAELGLSSNLDRQGWQIDLKNFFSDGRSAASSEWESLYDEWKGLLGEPFASMIEDPELPMDFLEYMKTDGSAQEEILDGVFHYRIDMVPANSGTIYQHITLWVDKTGKLIRTRATSINRRAELTTITEYRRLNGLDVPTERSYEGHIQSRRRSRISTLFFSISATYDDFAFTESPPGS